MEGQQEGFAFDELKETPATTIQKALADMKGAFLPLGSIFLDDIAEEDLTALLPQDLNDLSSREERLPRYTLACFAYGNYPLSRYVTASSTPSPSLLPFPPHPLLNSPLSTSTTTD